MTNPKSEAQKKVTRFSDVEDVVSIGALLRTTLVQAVRALSTTQKTELREILMEAETELAKSQFTFRERFIRASEIFSRTFKYAPIWHFISGRMEETWKEVAEPSVKELSVVSLLYGMMFEEVEQELSKGSKPSKKSRVA